MESTITLSQMADMIIVIFFCILAAGGVGFVIVEAIESVVDAVKAWKVARKERKAQK